MTEPPDWPSLAPGVAVAEDAVDGPQTGEVIVFEVDPTPLELRDGGGDVVHEPGHLRVLS